MAININRFSNPLTRAYLQSGEWPLRAYRLNGQQGSPLGNFSANATYNLGQLYGGNNPFLPNVTVNGTGQVPNQYYSIGGTGQLSASTTAPAVPNTNYNLSFNSNNQPNLSTGSTPTTPPNIPDKYTDWWAVQRPVSEANLTALLNDPANTTIVLDQLGITVTSDGAGNIVDVAHTPTALQRVAMGELTNKAALELPDIFRAFGLTTPAAPPLSQATKTPIQQPNPTAATLNPARPTGVANNPFAIATNNNPLRSPSVTSLDQLESALQSALQRTVARPAVDVAATGPNATFSIDQSKSLAFQRGQTALFEGPNLIKQLLTAKTFTEATTRTPAERNGIIPLVAQEAPYRKTPQPAFTGGLALQLGIGESLGGGSSGGATLLGLQLAQQGGADASLGGSQSFSPFAGMGAGTQSGSEQRRRPLTFLA